MPTLRDLCAKLNAHIAEHPEDAELRVLYSLDSWSSDEIDGQLTKETVGNAGEPWLRIT